MSFQAMADAVRVKTGDHASKHILMVLANFADENYECYPTVERIAEDAEMSPRSVRKWLSVLAEMGMIEIEERFIGGRQRSSKYRLQISQSVQTANNAIQTANNAIQTANNVNTDCKSRLQNLSLEPITEPITLRGAQNAPAAPRKGKSNGTRLDENWRPDDSDVDYARQAGLGDDEISTEFEKFQNYWLAKAGSAARKVDWGRTWRNWCLQAVGYRAKLHGSAGRAGGGKGGSAYERMHEAAGRVVLARAAARGDYRGSG